MSKAILIIEDDEFLKGLEATKLKKEGYEIFTAANSVEAFKVIDAGTKLDLVLLDLMLPEVDGFTILGQIRKGTKIPNIPVIVFSNLSEKADADRAEKLKISEFMIKSNFNLDELAQKVKELIGS